MHEVYFNYIGVYVWWEDGGGYSNKCAEYSLMKLNQIITNRTCNKQHYVYLVRTQLLHIHYSSYIGENCTYTAILSINYNINTSSCYITYSSIQIQIPRKCNLRRKSLVTVQKVFYLPCSFHILYAIAIYIYKDRILDKRMMVFLHQIHAVNVFSYIVT